MTAAHSRSPDFLRYGDRVLAVEGEMTRRGGNPECPASRNSQESFHKLISQRTEFSTHFGTRKHIPDLRHDVQGEAQLNQLHLQKREACTGETFRSGRPL